MRRQATGWNHKGTLSAVPGTLAFGKIFTFLTMSLERIPWRKLEGAHTLVTRTGTAIKGAVGAVVGFSRVTDRGPRPRPLISRRPKTRISCMQESLGFGCGHRPFALNRESGFKPHAINPARLGPPPINTATARSAYPIYQPKAKGTARPTELGAMSLLRQMRANMTSTTMEFGDMMRRSTTALGSMVWLNREENYHAPDKQNPELTANFSWIGLQERISTRCQYRLGLWRRTWWLP